MRERKIIEVPKDTRPYAVLAEISEMIKSESPKDDSLKIIVMQTADNTHFEFGINTPHFAMQTRGR